MKKIFVLIKLRRTSQKSIFIFLQGAKENQARKDKIKPLFIELRRICEERVKALNQLE